MNNENSSEEIDKYMQRLERVRRDFVANVSHELRTPLTVIQGYLEALLQNELHETKPLKKIFIQMHQHSTRMSHIIDDLLLLSQLESDDHPAKENIKIPIAKMLKTLCQEAKNFSGSKNHSITLSADSKLLLNGSESELRSLFSNIIFNAVKYTRPSGEINIEWFHDENHNAIFKVTDTGYGIAKKDIPRITERFYRVDKARSRESGGTGLGLAIVKHVLLRHQGEIHIESTIGKGSIFTCIFQHSRATLVKPTFDS